MAQGKPKLAQKKASGGRPDRNVKKGRRVVPPKAAAAIKHHTIQKKLSAKIHNSIERQAAAAASSGKLTIMKGVLNESSGPGVKNKSSARK